MREVTKNKSKADNNTKGNKWGGDDIYNLKLLFSI